MLCICDSTYNQSIPGDGDDIGIFGMTVRAEVRQTWICIAPSDHTSKTLRCGTHAFSRDLTSRVHPLTGEALHLT